MSLTFGYIRDKEIKEKGKANKYGVESASCESILRIIEILVDFTIFGATIYFVATLTPDQYHNMPFCIYWLIVDMVIMFFTLPYTMLAQYILILGDITKNIYTLYQIQKTKLKKRRDNVEFSDKTTWKKFFQEDEIQKKEKEMAAGDEVTQKKKPAMVLKNASAPPPVKKKKKKQTISEQINQENRDAEAADENLTSESSDSESEDESDTEFFLMANSRHEIVTKELDFDQNEELKFSNDVYNYTICANMTKCCSPLQQGFALKQCFIVFGIQVLIPLFFLIEFKTDQFQQPLYDSTAIRLICSLLLHMIIYGEVKQALEILRYLKYVKTAKGGKRGRFINILICSMQVISPIFTEVILQIAISQTKKLSMIIKSFVALGFVIQIDDMFS